MGDPSSSISQEPEGGIVDQVLSATQLIFRDPIASKRGGTIFLSYVSAPHLATSSTDKPDEPYAWETREFVRKKLIGKTAFFVKDFSTSTGPECGRVYVGGTSIDTSENIAEAGIKEGWFSVSKKGTGDYFNQLKKLHEQAKREKKGRWSEDKWGIIRHITWNIVDPRALIAKHKQKPINGIVEQIQDENSINVFLLPDFDHVSVTFEKAISSTSPKDREGEISYLKAHFLQRDVKIILKEFSNEKGLIGSVTVAIETDVTELLIKDVSERRVDSRALAPSPDNSKVFRYNRKVYKSVEKLLDQLELEDIIQRDGWALNTVHNKKIYNVQEFIKDADFYYTCSPPNLVQAASKLWFAVVWIVKEYFLLLKFYPMSHRSLRYLVPMLIDESPSANIRRLTETWKYAQEFHQYTYGTIVLDPNEFGMRKKAVEWLVQKLPLVNSTKISIELKKQVNVRHDNIKFVPDTGTTALGRMEFEYEFIVL